MINAEQLVTGRLGLLVDPVPGASVSQPPNLSLWSAERIVNWSAPNLVVLDASGDQIDADDQWWRVEEYKRLSLDSDGRYVMQHFRANEFDRALEPSIGGRRPDFVPFTFINAGDLQPEPTEPPLVGLARLALAIYRGEADYRQALFMQGQDTLVVIGGNAADGAQRVGAGSVIHLPRGGDAKFVGVASSGLPEMRQALQNDYQRAARLGLGLLDTSSRERESGEALKTRVAAATASLTGVTKAGAAGLENALRQAARWMGANEDEVVVNVNTEFSDDTFDPRQLTELMNSRQMGAPVSLQTIHAWLRDRDFAWMDFEDELQQIEAEHQGDVMREDAPFDAA